MILNSCSLRLGVCQSLQLYFIVTNNNIIVYTNWKSDKFAVIGAFFEHFIDMFATAFVLRESIFPDGTFYPCMQK